MRRIISFLLIGMLAVCGLTVFAAETGTASTRSNFDYKALEALLELGVVPSSVEADDFNPALQITRGEFANYIVCFLGLEDVSYSGVSVFADVPDTHPYVRQINIAVQCGILSGNGDGTFDPDEFILYEQCIKVIVSALGYNVIAEQNGGYPVGYLMQAQSILLTSKVNTEMGMPLSQGMIMQLLYNALSVDMLVQTGFGDKASFDVVKGRTILSETRDIEKVSGIVTSNSITALSGDAAVTKGKVMIDSQVYEAGATKANDLLGYNVTAFYKNTKGTSEKVLVYIYLNEGKNNELTINADDIISYINHQYRYSDERNNTVSVNFPVSSDVVFNGKSLASNFIPSNYDDANFVPLVGEVKLLDSNNDGIYDVIFITSYTILVVDSVDLSRKCIMSKEDVARNITFPENDEVKYKIIDEQGYDVPLETIKEWDVLSVAKSLDEMCWNIILSREQKSGTITSVTGQSSSGVIGGGGGTEQSGGISDGYSGVDKIWIDDIPYDVSRDFVGNASKLQLSAEGIFYIDTFGKIALFRSQRQNGIQYGYVKDILVDNEGMVNTLKFKMLNLNNEFITVSTADTVYVDEIRIKSKPEEIAKFFKDGTNVKPQPVKYQLNSKNEVTRIYTIAGGSIRSLLSANENSANEKYWSVGGTFESRVPVGSDAVVLMAPKPNSATAEDAEYTFKRRSALLNGSRYEYEAYNSDIDSDEADFIVVLNPATTAPAEQSIALVDKISTAINDDGELVQRISLLYMGAEVKKNAIAKNTFDYAVSEKNQADKYKLEQGDVIRFSSNLKGDIITAMLIFKNSSSEFMGNNTGAMDSQHRTVYGSVYEKKTDLIKICRDVSAFEDGFDIAAQVAVQKVDYYPYKQFKIYVYDKSGNGKVYIGSSDDIIDYLHGGENYSRVLVQTKNGNPDTLVVYK